MANELTTTQQHWEVIKRKARAFLMSGYLREEFTKGVSEQEALAKVVTIITMGAELGIGELQALRSINVIKGKPALAAELMLALALKRIPDFSAEFTTPTDKQHIECTVVFERRGKKSEFKWTIDDAKKAGMQFTSNDGKPTSWAKYPRAMLRARVVTEGLRAVAPDATMGLASLEELDREIVEIEELVPEPVNSIAKPNAAPLNAVPAQNNAIPEKTTTPKTPTGNTAGYDARQKERLDAAMSDAQSRKIFAVCKSLGMDDDERKEWLFEQFGVDSSRELTKAQASEAIKRLEQFGFERDMPNNCDNKKPMAVGPENDK